MRLYLLAPLTLLLAIPVVAQTPPGQTPPAQTPPGQTPPAQTSPGQTPPAQPPQRPATPQPTPDQLKLDAYMQRWEQEMQKIQTLAATLVREEKDTSFNHRQKFVGYAQYMKSQSGIGQAMLEMRPEGKQEVSERYIITGPLLYQFVPSAKEIRKYELPKPQAGQVGNDSLMSLMFGMRADDAKKRYDIRPGKDRLEDANYIFVDIYPRTPQDMGDFRRAQIVLSRDTFLPRRLWFEQPNGSEVMWDIPSIKAGVQVNDAFFQEPVAPQGWKLVPVPRNAEAPPSTIRGRP